MHKMTPKEGEHDAPNNEPPENVINSEEECEGK